MSANPIWEEMSARLNAGWRQRRIVRYHAEGKDPDQPREGDAGINLYCRETILLQSGETRDVAMGTSFELPDGCFAMPFVRSHARKNFVVLGGLFDSSYRGEYTITLRNITESAVLMHKDNSYVQIALLLHIVPVLVKVESPSLLKETWRGIQKWGSTLIPGNNS